MIRDLTVLPQEHANSRKEVYMNVDVKTVALPYEFTKPTGNPLFYVEEARLSNEQYEG
jgi:hypothetical protein